MSGRCDFRSRNILKITPIHRGGGGYPRVGESHERVPVSKIKARKSCGNEFQIVVHDATVITDDLRGRNVDDEAPAPINKRCKFDPVVSISTRRRCLPHILSCLGERFLQKKSVTRGRKNSQKSTPRRNGGRKPRPPLLKKCQYWLKVAQLSPPARRGVLCVIPEVALLRSWREGSKNCA